MSGCDGAATQAQQAFNVRGGLHVAGVAVADIVHVSQ